MVLIDTDTLATLPAREFRAGMAEVIKHAAIFDADYFLWLEDNIEALLNRDRDVLVRCIFRSCEIKATVVAEDEKEHGRRALLNFGHTFGHAIENSLGYGEWLHGEAVAVGMVMASQLSELPPGDCERLLRLIDAAGLPVEPPGVGSETLRAAMKLDKKVQHKKMRFVLLKAIGQAFVTSDYSNQRLDAVLKTADR